ncbi:RNase A-like domain-containing protein [Streptomyces sp. NPDC048462]|uniref:RNase A-like domain-containing protein n=1 Tax=Streptomyces sp. NPDC048462 TaxID=3365555 RepID=UPI00370FF4B4
MSTGDKVREIVTDVTGIEWPAADVGKLRAIAKAWRKFADDMEDVAAASNKAAQELIHHNTGEAISAFADPFWARYYGEKKGWLQDLVGGPRSLADGIDQYADAVADAKKKLDRELEIAGAVIVAGTALAFFTLGATEVAAAAATATIVELAATVGVALTTEVATIAGTVFATAAIAGIESVTVDLAVAQPLKIAAGLQTGGLNLDEAQDAGFYGALTGGAFGGAGKTFQLASEGGGWTSLLGGARLPGFTPQFALPSGLGGEAGDLGMLLRDGEPNAWPRNKRKGPLSPKYRGDIAGDEGKNGSHTIERHVEMTTRDLRARLRSSPGMDAASRYIDEGSAQRFSDAAMLKHQKEIGEWLASPKKKLALSEYFDEATGMSLTRENFKRGTAAQWVNGVQVVLKRDPSAANGYRILTSYPIA